MDSPLTPEEMAFLDVIADEGFEPEMPATKSMMAVGIRYADWCRLGIVWQEVSRELGRPRSGTPETVPPCPWKSREEYLARAREIYDRGGWPDMMVK